MCVCERECVHLCVCVGGCEKRLVFDCTLAAFHRCVCMCMRACVLAYLDICVYVCVVLIFDSTLASFHLYVCVWCVCVVCVCACVCVCVCVRV